MARLQHHGVPGHERPPQRTAREGGREVEGADHGPHPVRAAGPSASPRCSREPGHGPVEAVVPLHLLAVVADEVGGLGDVAHGLEPVLPDFEADQGGQVEPALLDEVGRPAQDRGPLLEGAPLQAGKRRAPRARRGPPPRACPSGSGRSPPGCRWGSCPPTRPRRPPRGRRCGAGGGRPGRRARDASASSNRRWNSGVWPAARVA